MTRDPLDDLAARINAVEDRKGVFYLAGGGTEVLPMLLANGGGSATLLSARVPYSPEDFRAVLGHDPGRFVDARAARALAMAAFRHALTIRGDLPPDRVFGLGSTSKLSRGEGEREGRSHEIHAAIQTDSATHCWFLSLPSGLDRPREERINARLLLQLVALGKRVDDDLPLVPDVAVNPLGLSGSRCDYGNLSMVDLLVGRRSWVALVATPNQFGSHREWADGGTDPPRLLLPGSFRPLHAGHLAMAEAASKMAGLPCDFELSIFHPEKPPLDYIALYSRLKGFEDRQGRVVLTNAPTYLEKARLFPGCTFVVGHDTALRIVDPRFYGGEEGRDRMLDELESLGAKFLVFGRVDALGQFREFSHRDFEHPVAGFLERSATSVPGDVFRVDLSSTEIRERSRGPID